MSGTIKYVPTAFAEPLNAAMASPPTRINVYDNNARRRFARATITMAAEQAENSIFGMLLIPKGSRILSSDLLITGTVGTAADVQIGLAGADGNGHIDDVNDVADDPDLLLATTAIQTTTPITFGRLGGLNAGYLTQKDVILTVKCVTAVCPITTCFTVDVQYVND